MLVTSYGIAYFELFEVLLLFFYLLCSWSFNLLAQLKVWKTVMFYYHYFIKFKQMTSADKIFFIHNL